MSRHIDSAQAAFHLPRWLAVHGHRLINGSHLKPEIDRGHFVDFQCNVDFALYLETRSLRA